MQKLGYEKYSLLGWSDGGKTAMMMALQKPGKSMAFLWQHIHYEKFSMLKFL